MSLLSAMPASAGPKEAAEQMEALLLKQLLSSAHLFGESTAPGASIRKDLFSEALAEAVAHAGGLGLASTFLPPAEKEPAALKGSGPRVEAGNEEPRDPRHV